MREEPTPFEIASLAVSLSKGNNPEDKLGDAWNLFRSAQIYRSRRLEDEQDQEDSGRASEAEFYFMRDNRFLVPKSDWDGVREYLSELGINLKKANSVKDNLLRMYEDAGDKERAKQLRNDFKNRKSIAIPTSALNDLEFFKKRIKHEGGNKAAKTAKSKKSSRK